MVAVVLEWCYFRFFSVFCRMFKFISRACATRCLHKVVFLMHAAAEQQHEPSSPVRFDIKCSAAFITVCKAFLRSAWLVLVVVGVGVMIIMQALIHILYALFCTCVQASFFLLTDELKN